MADTVELTDLEVISRYSLAVRAASADRADLIEALRADLAWLEGGRRAAAAKSEPARASAAPVGRAPAAKAPVKTTAAKKIAAKATAKKSAAKKTAAKKTARGR